MRAWTIAALLVWTVPGATQSQDQPRAQSEPRLNTETGDGLLDICSATDASGRDWMCYGYILGVGAMLRDIGSVCFPDWVTHSQVRDVIVGRLQAHPEERHERPEVLITKYLTLAFPCRPQPK